MRLSVVHDAQPHNIKWRRVVRMMRLRLLAADPARLFFYQTFAYCYCCHVCGPFSFWMCQVRGTEGFERPVLAVIVVVITMPVVFPVILGAFKSIGAGIKSCARLALIQKPVTHFGVFVIFGARLVLPAPSTQFNRVHQKGIESSGAASASLRFTASSDSAARALATGADARICRMRSPPTTLPPYSMSGSTYSTT